MMVAPVSTTPLLRRNRRGSRASSTAATNATTSVTQTSSASTAAPSVASLPHAEPCYNYFEMFPEEVGAVGNVEVLDEEEARMWQLVGRLVPEAEALAQGGCVKVTMDGARTFAYYSITDSDDDVYGRASYLPRCEAVAATAASRSLKEEASVFTESCCDACTAEEENESCSSCSTPCGHSTSMRCNYPVACTVK